MSGRAPSDPPLDDWFDEPQSRPERRGGSTPAADDWLDDGGAIGRVRRSALAARIPGGRRAVLAAGAAAVLVLLIGLAAGGVFSGGGGTTAPTVPTTTATPPPASAPTNTPAAAAGPATTLKPGAKGAQVRRLQRALAGLGYSPGKVDGSYGPATESALERFQRASKLSPDGILGPKTLAALTKALSTSG